MLVVISDLHLNDGTIGPGIQPGAFQIFGERLCDLAARASWRADGRYRPIERVDLLLLGDVLDILQSRRWHDVGTRPWEDPQSPKVAETVSAIVDGILQQNREAIGVLRSLYGEDSIHIPAASRSGEAVFDGGSHSVAVRTFYMVGNHDWPLHLTGTRYDLIRQKLANQIGLANSVSRPFPHDPAESDELLQVLRRHRVIARHGDVYDPLSYHEDRDSSALCDAIVIDLVGRFLVELQRGLAADLPAAALDGLRDVDRIRPLLAAPLWIDGLLHRTNVEPALSKHLRRMWDQLVDELLQLPLVREHDAGGPFPLIDGLERALKFAKGLPTGWLNQTTQWLQQLRGTQTDSYAPHALLEEDFRNRRARHIVYGHTHNAESVALDASYADGFVLHQMYFNAGTWRRIYQPARWTPSDRDFIPADCLSYLTFFSGDERGGRPFETWSGTLGTDTPDVITHRVDPARPNPEPHAAQTPHVAVRSPHFQRHAIAARAAGNRGIGG